MSLLNCLVSYIKKLIKQDYIIFNSLINYISYTTGEAHLITGKLEFIVKKDYLTFTMNYYIIEKKIKN